jgi:uncharacterized damage-inducible protein DinB
LLAVPGLLLRTLKMLQTGSKASSQLNEALRFTFVDGDKGQMTRCEMLMHVITHGAYHRGAVGRILVEQSVAAPRDLLTKFLHESEPLRRSA